MCIFCPQWLRFMKCDGSPDPTVNAEINTYINLWKEDESRNDLDAVLKESNQTLDVSANLCCHRPIIHILRKTIVVIKDERNVNNKAGVIFYSCLLKESELVGTEE